MKILEVAFVAHPVTDLARARRFYEGTLGLKPAQTWGDDTNAWIEYDIRGVTLAITNFVPEWKASSEGCCAGIEVEDLAAAVKEIEAAGYKVARPPQETTVCHMAVVLDPDGNAITLHQRKQG
jgi:predicted enzyme related to lactoylglutathione lyase